MSKTPVGEVRPSQLLWTFGPGALVDLPNLSVVTMGIDRWEKDRCQPIQEARLLSNVRSALGPQVESLRMPPISEHDIVDPFSAAALIGVPVKPFPRWLRCVKCGLLSPFDAGLFKLKERYRLELTRFVHESCRGSSNDQRARDADAVPARFLMACRAGHLDDFPWHWFVHAGPSDCRGTLRFFESGASLQTENLWVKCDGCRASRNMAQAFGQAARGNLPGCRGRHPHIDRFDDDCPENPRAILLGATNGWFPVTLSVLAIPQTGSPLAQLIGDGWTFFEDVSSVDEVGFVVKTLKKTAQLPGIEQFTSDQIWSAVEAYRSGGSNIGQGDLKDQEWEVLTAESPPTDYPHFMSKKVGVPQGFDSTITLVLLLERLREVNALLGFTRVESPNEGSGEDAAPRAPLGRSAPDWVPATQVYGEGIFIRFNTNALSSWANGDAVKSLDARLHTGHRGWRHKRSLNPIEGYPGARYVMLHTFAHMLMRELALECGYNAASIRERIYGEVDGDKDQAGFLIYTAAADSDGTLGGLVELGKPENLGRLLRQALERARVCASDPLCSEHDPSKDQSLHGAACHACSFVSETSCERGNRYLDRSLVVPTLDTPDAAFFGEDQWTRC
jgi:hypothetical protein